MAKIKLHEFTVLDDRVPIQKLSLSDQIRAFFKKVADNPTAALDREDMVTKATLQLKADYIDFLTKALEPIKSGIHDSVKLEVSNKFMTIIDEVHNSKKFSNGYLISWEYPDIDYDIPYTIIVNVEVLKR